MPITRMESICDFIKRYYKTLLFFAVVGLLGGFFVGLYTLDSYPPSVREELATELNKSGLGTIPIDIAVAVTTAVQSLLYGVALGALGILLGKKTGFWKDEISITKKPLTYALPGAIGGGLLMILSDLLFFNNVSEAIKESYATKPSLAYILATVTYGAVIEEVMLRLFLLSLVTWLLHKIFKKDVSNTMGMVANLICALLFAAGHLPATALLIGLTPWTVLRCFLLNGGLGLLFGWLYRKWGLRYAMIAHGGCHVVSKLIWILFL